MRLVFPRISITIDSFCLSQSSPSFVQDMYSLALRGILFVRVPCILACISSLCLSLLATILSYDSATICWSMDIWLFPVWGCNEESCFKLFCLSPWVGSRARTRWRQLGAAFQQTLTLRIRKLPALHLQGPGSKRLLKYHSLSSLPWSALPWSWNWGAEVFVTRQGLYCPLSAQEPSQSLEFLSV